jgi:DNA-binding NarL/FixJ family response regulator
MPALHTYIVEDSPVILENLVATLEELASVKVIGSAPDEAAAVDWLTQAREPCELMIIDLFLKSGSGLSVLRAAARAPRPPRRVVLTNYATPDMRARCNELGAERVFDKSSELEDLIAYCAGLAQGAADHTAAAQR